MTDASVEEKRRALRALLIQQQKDRGPASADSRVSPVPRPVDGLLPLSWQQEGLWFLYEVDRDSATYHLPVVFRVRGGLDVGTLGVALGELVGRHEGLRSRFGVRDGVAYQVVDEAPGVVEVPVVRLPDAGWEGTVRAELERPFDLAGGWGFRWWVGEFSELDHVVALTAHHIATDGWSTGIVVRELGVLYEAALRGMDARLPGVAVQPGDFAVWQRERFAAGGWERGLGYWRDRLAGLGVVEFPSDRPRAVAPTGAGALIAGSVRAQVAADAVELAARLGVSVLAVLSAAFFVVFGRYSGQDDLEVGSVFAGRTRSELEPVVGLLANTVVLRVNAGGDPSFRELVRRCHEAVVGALEFQDVPFAAVVEAVGPQRVAGRNPLFQTSFSLLPDEVAGGVLELGGLPAEPVSVGQGGARFDVRVEVGQRAGGALGVWVEYSTELFDQDRIERLVQHFGTVLEAAVAEPKSRISELPLMSQAEYEQVTRGFNASFEDLGLPWDRPVHEVVAAQAGATPDRCAVWCDGVEVAYRELDGRANAVARHLRGIGVGPGAVVGVRMRRSVELVVALLGVLKSGAAYLPLDPDLPAARLDFQIADAAAAVVLTEDVVASLAAAPTVGGRSADIHPDTAAYVMYTSGSTGTPKGVVVGHGGLLNRMAWMQAEYGLDGSDVVVQKTPFTFDVSLWEFFWPLMVGARLVVSAPDGHRDFGYLADLLRKQRVTVAHFVPSVLRGFLGEAGSRDLPALRRVFCSGEALSVSVRDAVFEAWPQVELHNLYGPTEASIEVTAWACDPQDGAVVPIGRPISNLRTYVLDARGNPAPIGIPGELYLAGTGLALGYLNRLGLTAERFVPCRFAGPGERMYRTGDLARWRPDGALEYLGRNDDQVKIRGVRVELGEIEHALTDHPAVDAAAVAVCSPADAEPFLAAYLVGSGIEEAQVRGFLADRLPLHMVPAVFTTVDALPLTGSGKLDRKALPDPEQRPATAHRALTGTEQALAGIWSTLLDQPADRIHPQDNFFTRGGSSLDLARLTAAVRERLGVGLLVRDLYLAPTLAAAAAAVDARLADTDPRPPASASCLVPLRAAGSRPPLFLVHALGGSAVPYLPLTELLDPEQPVYGLEAPGLHDGGQPWPHSLGALALHYVALVRETQPHGPYRLGGWSGGGVIAQEMGAVLRAAGEEISLLALFDSVPAQPGAQPPDQAGLLAWFAHDLAGLQGGEPLAFDLAHLRALPPPEQFELVLDRLGKAGLIRDSAPVRDEVRARFRVFAATAHAFLQHRPRPIDRPITVLTAAEATTDPASLWRPFTAAGLTVHPVPGSHYTMLQAPHVNACAAVLRSALAPELPTPQRRER